MVLRQPTSTSAGVGVVFRRPIVAPAGHALGMLEIQAGQAVSMTDEAHAINSTGAETFAVSFATHVAMVELYRLEGRLAEEQRRRKQEKEAKKAVKKQRKLARKERRKRRDEKRSKERRQEKKAERKERKMARRQKKSARKADKLEERRTKVTVKIIDDSQGALLMLDGQLPIPVDNPGLRLAAAAAIQQSMELERRFINRPAASKLMNVKLELHWMPGHSKLKPLLHKKPEAEAVHACKMGHPKRWIHDLHGELPACDKPAMSFLPEQIGDQQPLPTSTSD
ncbi:hypothetical protein SMACR_07696 [Sordaria macrospora]|uniref:Uncharacterized protein n=1 Tax=Sordaria macrospora TaxID=5147 RepID=A0A8S8ZY18_SORMA|nr:hypothetical protein SMACR_07696 [Sordaria macrospora]KAH7635474.1 hypothetical protein B0T09DRAFT_255001 [Sordaria sp. MPI-SDFR-AT-0083]WPJ67406.1 hypothetical protein SMAC4_07696 [Sordaria macrospora]